jgi:hypothetical protein
MWIVANPKYFLIFFFAPGRIVQAVRSIEVRFSNN